LTSIYFTLILPIIGHRDGNQEVKKALLCCFKMADHIE